MDFLRKIKDLNPDNYVYEYFEEIKRQVDIRREDLKLKIDVYSNELINEITQTQHTYRDIARANEDVASKLAASKEDLDKLIAELAAHECSTEGCKDSIALQASDIINDFDEMLFDNTNYKFEFKNLTIESIFGSFTSKTGVILQNDHSKQSLNQSLKKIYSH